MSHWDIPVPGLHRPDLVPLSRGAGIEAVMQRRRREQGQRIRLLLGQRGPPHFRLEPPPDDHHAVLALIDAKPSAPMPLRGLPSLGPPVYTPPAADDPLDMGGRARAPDAEEPRFGLRRGHAGEGADLGVGQLPTGEGLGEERQRPEGARDPHPFTGGAQVEPDPPGEPGGAGAEARVPPASGVELPDHGEKPRGGGVEVRGQLGDLVAEAVQLRDARRGGDDAWRMRFHGERPLC